MTSASRNSSPDSIVRTSRTFFVTTKTSMGRALLQFDRNATLFFDVLRSYVAATKFKVPDFVVMPDHVYLLITVSGDMSIEKAVQFIKGGFSYRFKKEFGYCGEVWQKGFSEVRVNDENSFAKHREYIAQNPVKRGLAHSAEDYPYCFTYLAKRKAAGAKAQVKNETFGTTEVVPRFEAGSLKVRNPVPGKFVRCDCRHNMRLSKLRETCVQRMRSRILVALAFATVSLCNSGQLSAQQDPRLGDKASIESTFASFSTCLDSMDGKCISPFIASTGVSIGIDGSKLTAKALANGLSSDSSLRCAFWGLSCDRNKSSTCSLSSMIKGVTTFGKPYSCQNNLQTEVMTESDRSGCPTKTSFIFQLENGVWKLVAIPYT